MRFKASIMDAQQMRRSLIRMSHEIIEKNRGSENIALVGIHRRGVPIAKALADIIFAVEGKRIPVGTLDITLYRDDLSLVASHPQIKNTDIPFTLTNANIILVDDVLYTGRTVRAAMDCLMDMGRPKTIQLAVLVDRGNHELPISGDYVGKVLPTSKEEVVSVSVIDIDGEDKVEIQSLV